MRLGKYATPTILLLICLLGMAWSTQRPAPSTQWEYRLSGKLDIKQEDLNQLGAQGWELVTIDQRILNGSDYTVTYIFKRPKRQ